jgi:hypothetical protein
MTPLLVLLLSLAAPPGTRVAAATSKKEKPPAAPRELARRSVTVDDATKDVPLSVGAGVVTTLSFSSAVESVFLPDPKGLFDGPPQSAGKVVFLRPLKELVKGEALTMQVTLTDGTSLPPFLITSTPERADLFLDVSVQLQKKASADSASNLKVQLSELMGRLDECQQSSGDKGAIKVAEMVLKQDFSKPAAFVVERHNTRQLDKQAKLLVETRHLYRLFDTSYLVLTIENREPDRLWVFERAEVQVEGGSTVEARVLDVAQEMSAGIPSGEESKMVIVFRTPEQDASHAYTLKLFEKSGNRHVVLSGLKL